MSRTPHPHEIFTVEDTPMGLQTRLVGRRIVCPVGLHTYNVLNDAHDALQIVLQRLHELSDQSQDVKLACDIRLQLIQLQNCMESIRKGVGDTSHETRFEMSQAMTLAQSHLARITHPQKAGLLSIEGQIDGASNIRFVIECLPSAEDFVKEFISFLQSVEVLRDYMWVVSVQIPDPSVGKEMEISA